MDTSPADRAPQAGCYRIRIRGRLASRWATRFEGMTLLPQADGTTLIQGPVVDQAALHGLLQQVRDTGLPLISVTPAGPDRPHSAAPLASHAPRKKEQS
jgi:hypothetical protein